MNKIILILLCLVAAFSTASAQKNKAAAERQVKFESYSDARYFERNDSNLKGKSSYLIFDSQEKFEQIFGYATTSGDNRFLPENVFDSKLVVATIKRGESIYNYDLKKVTVKNKKLYVWYDVAPKNPAAVEKTRDDGSYSYASSCFLTVDKNNYSEVIFMENGKRVGAVSVSQSR
jgi:phospholipase/lecithinase/hemolysin